MKFDPKDFWGIPEIEGGDTVRVVYGHYNVTKVGSEGIVKRFIYNYRKGPMVEIEFFKLTSPFKTPVIGQVRENDVKVIKKHYEVE